MRHDPMLIVRSDLLNRIEDLAEHSAQLAAATFCDQLDAIRAIARMHRLDAVERLASLLTSVQAFHGHRQIAQTYLDLMRDAALADMPGENTAHVYLAMAALRGAR